MSYIIKFFSRLNELEDILTQNRIWKNRLINIGVLCKQNVVNYNISGVLLRSTGISWDLRKMMPYELYNKIPFNLIIGNNGDCFDRYLIRLYEMRECCYIIL